MSQFTFYDLVPGSGVIRIGALCFLAGCRRRQLSQGFVALCLFCLGKVFCICFLCVLVTCVIMFLCFQLSVPMQSIVGEDLLPK